MGLRGELIKAFVVLRDGEKTTTAELLDHCRKELAKFKVLKRSSSARRYRKRDRESAAPSFTG